MVRCMSTSRDQKPPHGHHAVADTHANGGGAHLCDGGEVLGTTRGHIHWGHIAPLGMHSNRRLKQQSHVVGGVGALQAFMCCPSLAIPRFGHLHRTGGSLPGEYRIAACSSPTNS